MDEIYETNESNKPQPISTHKSITRHYQTSKKIRFNRKTGVFQQEWLRIYPWLIYDASKKLMFCSICKAHKMLNRFAREGIIYLLNLLTFDQSRTLASTAPTGGRETSEVRTLFFIFIFFLKNKNKKINLPFFSNSRTGFRDMDFGISGLRDFGR
jgi:hypothetical protein